jgi:two-component system response regulator FixJ
MITLHRNKLPVILTDKQWEVIKRKVNGLLGKEIAFQMGVSSKTIEVHVLAAYRKMGVSTIAQLVVYCFVHGAVTVDSTMTKEQAKGLEENWGGSDV